MAVYRKPPENFVHMFLVTLLPVLVVSRWIRFFYRIPGRLSPKAAFFTETVDVGADGSLASVYVSVYASVYTAVILKECRRVSHCLQESTSC